MPPPALVVTIGGATVTHQVRHSLGAIIDLLNERPNTISFSMEGTPSHGQEVKIGLGGVATLAQLLFAGYILKRTQRMEGGLKANVVWDLECIDYTWRLGHRRVTKRYATQSATAIILDLMTFAPAGFTTVGVVAGLPSCPEISFTQDPIPDAIGKVMDRVGGYWYVDYLKDIHAFLTEAGGPVAITDANVDTAIVGPFTLVDDISQIATRVIVQGAGSSVALRTTASHDRIPLVLGSAARMAGLTKAIVANQVITGGLSDLGGRTTVAGLVVSLTAPTCALASAGAKVSAALGNITYYYVWTEVRGSLGESNISAYQTVVPTLVAAPSGAWNGSGTTGGALTVSTTYEYKFTYGTSLGETALSTGGQVSTGASDTAISLTGIPVSTDARVIKRRIYRNKGGGASAFYLVGELADNTTQAFTDTIANNSLTQAAPTVYTAGTETVQVTCPAGTAGTTSRRVYRTRVGGGTQGPFFLIGTINDNTGATVLVDGAPDDSLTQLAPAVSTLGTPAGSTTLVIVDATNFQTTSTSGAVDVGGQRIRGVASGSTISSIPASGDGSLRSDVRVGTEVAQLPLITVGPTATIEEGDALNLIVQRDNAAAQTALAALMGGNGIVEHFMSKSDASVTEAQAEGDAYLSMHKNALRTIAFATRDENARSGKDISVTIGAPQSVTTVQKIQSVEISQVQEAASLYPLRTISASSRRYSAEDMLRRLNDAVDRTA